MPNRLSSLPTIIVIRQGKAGFREWVKVVHVNESRAEDVKRLLYEGWATVY